MAFMIWNRDFSVGVDALDADHIILISLLNHLHDAHKTGSESMVLDAVLEALLTYVDIHFEREEEMMVRANYPGYRDHKDEHIKLARRIDTLRARWETEGSREIADDVLAFVKSWLTDHILTLDMKYVPYVKSMGA